MKNIILYSLFLFTFIFSYGQEENGKTYKFLNPEVVNNVSRYNKALSTADMTNFRYLDKSSIFEFKGGLLVELFSANTLVKSGIDVDKSRILKSKPNNIGQYIFDISLDGKYVTQLFTKTKIK
jgi:hypothetical protein